LGGVVEQFRFLALPAVPVGPRSSTFKSLASLPDSYGRPISNAQGRAVRGAGEDENSSRNFCFRFDSSVIFNAVLLLARKHYDILGKGRHEFGRQAVDRDDRFLFGRESRYAWSVRRIVAVGPQRATARVPLHRVGQTESGPRDSLRRDVARLSVRRGDRA